MDCTHMPANASHLEGDQAFVRAPDIWKGSTHLEGQHTFGRAAHIWKGTYWPVVLDLFFYLAAGRNMNAIKTLTIVNKPIAASASDQ